MDFARLNVDVAIRCNGCRYTRNMKAGGGRLCSGWERALLRDGSNAPGAGTRELGGRRSHG
jgi:hypothetical protein